MPLPLLPPPPRRRPAAAGPALGAGTAGPRRAVRVRRLRALGRRHPGHARPLARARAGDPRASRLGHAGTNADALGPRRLGRHVLHARVAFTGRVAGAPRARRLPGAWLLRLVRQAPVQRRRRHRLGGPKARLDELDRVAHGDFARVDDAREHPALALELAAQALAQLVHPVARVADHRDLEQRFTHTDLLSERPLLDVVALHGQVLADRAGLDADGVEMLERHEQPLALRRIPVRAAVHSLAGDRAEALV